MSDRIFVAADWSQLETWLTAHFSGDETMKGELEGQLTGGYKIHAINAATIYDIDPADAKDHMVNLKGVQRPAYDGGKRLCHAFNYGMGAKHMAETFWIELREAERISELLSDKYAKVVAWRNELADGVFGVNRYSCPNHCGFVQDREGGRCPRCSRPKKPAILKWDAVITEPSRVLYTPFRRRRWYLGRRSDGANAVASQLPQSCGASMWYRTLSRLYGYDGAAQAAWPVGPGSVTWSPRLSFYGSLYAPVEVFVATGTYDSYLQESSVNLHEDVLEWLLWTMEQPWPELGGLRFPAEGSIGYNWGKYDKARNPKGLRDIERVPFSSRNPF